MKSTKDKAVAAGLIALAATAAGLAVVAIRDPRSIPENLKKGKKVIFDFLKNKSKK